MRSIRGLLQYIRVFFLFLCVATTNHARHVEKKEKIREIEITIPFPSGIRIDRIEPVESWIYRFGRLQHNSINLRPEWAAVHEVEDVLTPAACKKLIKLAEKVAAARPEGWNSSRHVDFTVQSVSNVPVDQIFATSVVSDHEEAVYRNTDLERLLERLHDAILLPMSEEFGLEYTQLQVEDMFINKYDASSGSDPEKRSMKSHTDSSQFSFIVQLTDTNTFEGGGTVFPDLEEIWEPELGSAIFYAGMNYHGARKVVRGTRYVLAGFVAYGDTPFRLDLYQPEYDGFAAQAGFENGDLIAGVEVCEKQVQVHEEDQRKKVKGAGNNNDNNHQKAGLGSGVEREQPRKLRRHMHRINTSTSDEEWIQAAQSCEELAYGEPTRLLVRRRVGSHVHRGSGDDDDDDDDDEL
jgi:hypothetical protein